jgi:threonylcarbamoyladenosine tRNA methylthiotransferase MtaB
MKKAAPKVQLFTLGCKVNQCDSEAIAHALAERGYEVTFGIEPDSQAVMGLTPDPRPFDSAQGRLPTQDIFFVVNTCSVTAAAEAKARKLIRKLAKSQPAGIIVTGCYAERAGEMLSQFAGVAAVVPNSGKDEIAVLLETLTPAPAASPLPSPAPHADRTRAFVKVQDGCDQACAYCIVHTLRGAIKSKPLSRVLAETAGLAAQGFKEIVLCGIRLGAYGEDLGQPVSLARLLGELRPIPLPRLRLSSMEPLDINEEFIAEIADHPSLCRHLHLPLQSGDDKILAAMGRSYSLAEFRRLTQNLRRAWPDLSLTTDIIVGFPGEDDAAFQNTLTALSEFNFARVHVFRFSPRPGTPASRLKGQVPEIVKRERSEAVQQAARELFQQQTAGQLGKSAVVLFEQINPATGRWGGLTPYYLRVEAASREALSGEIRPVKITGATEDCLIGELGDRIS